MPSVPKQIIWGADDIVIPVSHARIAHAAMPDSRIDIFEGSGHLPFHDHPERFVDVIERFVDSTAPARHDEDRLGSLMKTGIERETTSMETQSVGA